MARFTLKIWILIVALILAALAISPTFEKGIVIKSVEKNSTAFEAGLRKGELIKAVNNQPVKTISDYVGIVEKVFPTANKTKITITSAKTS